MLIINKNRIKIIVLSITTIALFVFTFQIAHNNKINQAENTTIETTSTPVSGKTVILDAGHGVPDEGAESSSRHF